MSVLVLDASVAVKWVLPAKGEPLIDEAGDLLKRYANSEISFVVPDLFWAETTNVLWKATRQGRLTRPEAQAALVSLEQRNFPTVSSRVLVTEAYAIATAFDCTVYDGLYVALAVASNARLITADQRLATALGPRWPVKWLGAA